MRRRLFWTLMALNLVLIGAWWVVGMGVNDASLAAMDARRSCQLRVEQGMEARSNVANVFMDETVVSGTVVRVEFSWRDVDDGVHQDAAECRVTFADDSASIEQVRLP